MTFDQALKRLQKIQLKQAGFQEVECSVCGGTGEGDRKAKREVDKLFCKGCAGLGTQWKAPE